MDSHHYQQTSDLAVEDKNDNHVASYGYRTNRGRVQTLSDELNSRLSQTIKRAKDVKAELSLASPSFIKQMVLFHLSQLYTLDLPYDFCKNHLPCHDVSVVLEAENGKKHTVKFLAEENKFDGSWKRFAIAHRLNEGDFLVFHLVTPFKFKVYIVRAVNDDEDSPNDWMAHYYSSDEE